MSAHVYAIITQLEAFLHNPSLRNAWIETRCIKLYVRKGVHAITPKKGSVTENTCLDVANIEFNKPIQGKGYFSELIEKIEGINPYCYTFIENTLNPLVKKYCLRHGYTELKHVPDCFYKITEKARLNMGVLNEAVFFRGNVISDYQRSQYVRSYNKLECNGMKFFEGELRQHDLETFSGKNSLSGKALDQVMELSKNQTVILYTIMHYSTRTKEFINDGYLITDENHKLLWQFVYTYRRLARAMIDKAIEAITIEKEQQDD